MKEVSAPIYFIGHGSPMNAIAENDYTTTLQHQGSLYRPKAVLVISAHWQTKGTMLTMGDHPKTIHDFYGFPKELSEVQYPAPGDNVLVGKIQNQLPEEKIGASLDWGLDHGTWSVLRHLYPKADIPVVQLSLDVNKTPREHFELAKKLRFLRQQEVLIIGSGNIVHNLKMLNWQENANPFPWAVEFNDWIKSKLLAKNFDPLVDHFQDEESGKKSVPTLEHFLPFIYTLGAGEDSDKISVMYDEIQNSSISMLSIQWNT